MNTLRYISRMAFVAVLLSGMAAPALATVYKVDLLGSTEGGRLIAEPDINASGAVAGTVGYGEDASQSVLWNAAGQLINLTPSNGRVSNTAGISDAGVVVYSESGRFYTWDAGIVTDLGVGSPEAVNGKGQIAGTFGGVFGVWTNGVVSPLPLPASVIYSSSSDINNNADVVGSTYFTVTSSRRAVIWRNGTMQEIGTLPGDVSSIATSINDAGQVVGYSVNSARKWRAFLWENGVIRDLGFPDGVQSAAFGINNAGQIAGWSYDPSKTYGRAFVWQNGVLRDLSLDLGGVNCSASDINNAGQLFAVCNTIEYPYVKHFRLTPVGMAADLSVTLSATPLPATVGKPLVYTTTVTSIGNIAATNATLTQTLPASGFTIMSLVSSRGSCGGTTVVTCAFGNLASGESAVVTITAIPLAISGSTAYYNSSVVVATSTPDVNPENSLATISFAVFANNAALSVHSINSQVSAIRDGNITYTWEVSNGGPLAASNATLTDRLPSSLSLVSVKTTAGTCTGTVTITCNLGEHRFGPIKVTIVAKAKVRGTITNSATVTSTTPDTYLGDNTAAVTTRVR